MIAALSVLAACALSVCTYCIGRAHGLRYMEERMAEFTCLMPPREVHRRHVTVVRPREGESVEEIGAELARRGREILHEEEA